MMHDEKTNTKNETTELKSGFQSLIINEIEIVMGSLCNSGPAGPMRDEKQTQNWAILCLIDHHDHRNFSSKCLSFHEISALFSIPSLIYL